MQAHTLSGFIPTIGVMIALPVSIEGTAGVTPKQVAALVYDSL